MARSERRPDRADKLNAHADTLHVAVTCGKEFRTAANEIDSSRLGGMDARYQQCAMQSASTECGIGGRIRAIADLVVDIERRCGRGLTFDPGEIERPAWLMQPGADVRLELRCISKTPARDIGREII